MSERVITKIFCSKSDQPHRVGSVVATDAVFVKVVEANGSYAAGSAGSNGGLIQADPGR